MLRSDDDVVDVFSHVCQALLRDDLKLLRRYTEQSSRAAQFSTWLVTVVHNQTIDWLRSREGRPRASAPPGLSSLQLQIFQHIFLRHRSHAETFEIVRTSAASSLTFGSYLKEVAETYRAVNRRRGAGVLRYFRSPQPGDEQAASAEHELENAELGRRLGQLLESLPPDERLAVQLFVVDEMPAADVARMVGWPNAKAVYNRVYRALATLRERLEQQMIGPADL